MMTYIYQLCFLGYFILVSCLSSPAVSRLLYCLEKLFQSRLLSFKVITTVLKTSISMGDAEKTDVLVIGAGPAGLMLANSLGRLGTSVKVIEQRSNGQMYGQADGIQPGTLEVFASYGISERILQAGQRVYSFAYWKLNPETQCIERQNQIPDVQVSDTRYPFELTIPIETLEGILKNSAQDYGIGVEQPFSPTSLKFEKSILAEFQNSKDYPIQVTLESPYGQNKRTIQAKYLVGCDGSRSWVRQSANIKMENRQDIESVVTWGVLDYTPVGNFPGIHHKNVVIFPNQGAIASIPRPGGTARMYITLDSSPWHGRQPKEVELLGIAQQMAKKFLHPYTLDITNVTWISTYRVRQQVAETFSLDNRIFIAGDACHTHSPSAGQGANVSMRDAHNLGWKLAYVLRGWASPSILSTYDEERRAVAEELIKIDKEALGSLEASKDGTEGYRTMYEAKLRFLTGIGVCYTSRLTANHAEHLASNLKLGERIMPAMVLQSSSWCPVDIHHLVVFDGHFRLLIFPGDISIESSMQVLQAFEIGIKNFLQILLLKRGSNFLRLYTILRSKKTAIRYTDLPGILNDPARVYIDDALVDTNAHGKTYEYYGIAQSGAAVLIRPDAHISMISSINDEGVQRISSFLLNL